MWKSNDVEVKVGLLNDAISIAKQAKEVGVDVIVSRGGTASIIKEVVPEIPLIEMGFSVRDMYTLLNRARNYGKNIEVIGFENMIGGIEVFKSISDINLNVHYIKSIDIAENYLVHKLQTGKKVDILIGGIVAEKLAHKYGLQTLHVATNGEIIDSSIQEARKIVYEKHVRQEHMQSINDIITFLDMEQSNDHINTLKFNLDKFKMIYKSKTLEELKIIYIKHVLNLNKFNQTETAKMLGISRTQLWRYMKKYNI